MPGGWKRQSPSRQFQRSVAATGEHDKCADKRQDCSADALLHGAAARLARHEALIRVPGDAPPALLVLTSRDDGRLNAGAGMLAFLGRAVATALGR